MKDKVWQIPVACALGCAGGVADAGVDAGVPPNPLNPPELPKALLNPERVAPPVEAAAPPNGDAAGVVAACEFELPNGNEEPKIEGDAAVADVGAVFGAAEDCANAKGAGDVADAAWVVEDGVPKRDEDGAGDVVPNAVLVAPKGFALPNVGAEEPNPPPPPGVELAPNAPNDETPPLEPNKPPPAGELPGAEAPDAGGVAPKAGVVAAPNENTGDEPCEGALNPANPDIA